MIEITLDQNTGIVTWTQWRYTVNIYEKSTTSPLLASPSVVDGSDISPGESGWQRCSGYSWWNLDLYLQVTANLGFGSPDRSPAHHKR